ncbi:hypothetical protein IAT38_001962 [Cryptococcus sp. DSM 104549]
MSTAVSPTTGVAPLPSTDIPTPARPQRSSTRGTTLSTRRTRNNPSGSPASPASASPSVGPSNHSRQSRSASRGVSQAARERSPPETMAGINGVHAEDMDVDRMDAGANGAGLGLEVGAGVVEADTEMMIDPALLGEDGAAGGVNGGQDEAAGQEDVNGTEEHEGEMEGEGEEELDEGYGQNGEDDSPLDVIARAAATQQEAHAPSAQEETKKNVIRLVLGGKRKAEDDEDGEEDEDEEDEGERIEETEVKPVLGMDLEEAAQNMEIEGEAEGEGEGEEVAEAEASAGAVEQEPVKVEEKPQAPKRAPRKRRKWLKKGEVDPDDPIAVARQQERHRMIDEAIRSLDEQEKELLKDEPTHPQCVALWDELAMRQAQHLKFAAARKDAAIEQLGRMRDHELQSARFDCHARQDELKEVFVRGNRQKMARLAAERTVLKRNPSHLPTLREGRGGGGWTRSEKDLLSTGQQSLVPVEVDGEVRQRRDIPRQIMPLNNSDIKSDLLKMGAVKPPPPPPRSPSPPPRRTSISNNVYYPSGSAHSMGSGYRTSKQAVRPQWQPPAPKPHYSQPPPTLPLPSRSHWDRPSASSMYHPPPPPAYDSRTVHDYDRRERLPPPPQMQLPRVDGGRYGGYWSQSMAGGAPSSGLGTKMPGQSSSSGYYPSYPRTAVHPPSLGMPPRA